MKITSLIKTAAMAGAAVTMSAMAAFAVQATATVELNVRTGPGTNFGVIDTLAYGEHVNTTECVSSGWCYIEQAEQNGWVSSSYLRAVPPPPPPAGTAAPDCKLTLTLGGGSPRLELVCTPAPGTGPMPPPPPPPPPVGAQACFYTGPNFQGTSFCYAPGQLSSLNAQFNNRISSVRVSHPLGVRLCTDNNLGGFCIDITSNRATLGALINNRTSSLKVFAPGGVVAPPPIIIPPIIVPPIIVPPVIIPNVFRSGNFSIPSSFTANFDTGVTGGAGVDVWHHAINAAVRRLEVRNGARLAVGNGSNRGYIGCKNAAFSANPVPFAQLSVGTFVCLKTNAGRIAQFRVNGYTGTTLKVSYTVWKH